MSRAILTPKTGSTVQIRGEANHRGREFISYRYNLITQQETPSVTKSSRGAGSRHLLGTEGLGWGQTDFWEALSAPGHEGMFPRCH